MAFDITKALGDIASPKEDTGKPELRYIPLHLIDRDPRNFYSTEGIEELADNIRMFGLMEPLIVRETVPPGHYILVSGHRRRLALRKIAEEAENYPESMHEKVACLVQPENTPLPGIEPDSDDEFRARQLAEELKLIFANSDTRVLTSADTAMQVRKIRELFAGLQELGYQFPGKMRDHVAAAAKVSASRVARLDVIEKGLTEPTLREAWQDGAIGETTAYEIARRAPDVQRLAAQRLGAKVLGSMSTETAVNALDACEADGKRDCEAREDWNRNVGAMAEAAGNGGKFDGKEYLRQRQEEDDEFFEMLADVADRYIPDMGALNSRQEGIERLKKEHRHHGGCTASVDYTGSAKGLTMYRFAPKNGPSITRSWTEVYDMLCTIALSEAGEVIRKRRKHQNVSAADTGIQLQTGTPAESGEYMTRAGVGSEETPQTAMWQRLEWHSMEEVWCFPKTGAPLPKGTNVFRWFKLPEV